MQYFVGRPSVNESVPEPVERNALERVSSAGHRLLVHRVELFEIEMKRSIMNGVWILLGGGVALMGWVFTLQSILFFLSPWIPVRYAELVIGLLHIALGLGAILHVMGRRIHVRE